MRYVYGIVRADHPLVDLHGVGRPPRELHMVASGPIAAPVSEVPDDFSVDEMDARAHVHALIALLPGGPVIPLRLGTVAPDDAAVRTEVLEPVQAEMLKLLDDLEGLVELQVDADDNEADAIAAIAESVPRPGDSSDLAAKLDIGETVASLLIQHRQRLAEAIIGRLRPLAVRDVPRSVIEGPEDPVLRWAFLVRDDDLVNFDEAVVGIRSEYPTLSIRYVGPLPPAHFVERNPQAAENADSFRGSGNWGW